MPQPRAAPPNGRLRRGHVRSVDARGAKLRREHRPTPALAGGPQPFFVRHDAVEPSCGGGVLRRERRPRGSAAGIWAPILLAAGRLRPIFGLGPQSLGVRHITREPTRLNWTRRGRWATALSARVAG